MRTLSESMLHLRTICPFNVDHSYLTGAAKVILESIKNGEIAGDSAELAINEWLAAYEVSKEEQHDNSIRATTENAK